MIPKKPARALTRGGNWSSEQITLNKKRSTQLAGVGLSCGQLPRLGDTSACCMRFHPSAWQVSKGMPKQAAKPSVVVNVAITQFWSFVDSKAQLPRPKT